MLIFLSGNWTTKFCMFDTILDATFRFMYEMCIIFNGINFLWHYQHRMYFVSFAMFNVHSSLLCEK
jgi:hypothetical protein